MKLHGPSYYCRLRWVCNPTWANFGCSFPGSAWELSSSAGSPAECEVEPRWVTGQSQKPGFSEKGGLLEELVRSSLTRRVTMGSP